MSDNVTDLSEFRRRKIQRESDRARAEAAGRHPTTGGLTDQQIEQLRFEVDGQIDVREIPDEHR